MPAAQTRLAASRISRRPVQRVRFRTPIIRQWKLLELLSSAPEGITVEEFAKAAGTCDKTIRRDLILLRKVGFDLDETVGAHGHKSWRVRQSFEKLRSPRQRYKAILDTLDVLLMQVSLAGDRRLVRELEAIRRRVERSAKRVAVVERTSNGSTRSHPGPDRSLQHSRGRRCPDSEAIQGLFAVP